jgi:hypothetical protein
MGWDERTEKIRNGRDHERKRSCLHAGRLCLLACLLVAFYPHQHPRASVADPEGVYSRPRNYKTVDGVDVLDEKRRAHLT